MRRRRACGTCHVYVDPEWMERVPPATDEEMDQLDQIFEVQENSASPARSSPPRISTACA